MKFKRSYLLLPITLFALECGIKKEFADPIEIIADSAIYNYYYNTDSTYYVSRNSANEQNGLPESFVVIETITSDTIFVTDKVYDFLKWEGDKVIALQKRIGIINKENRYDFNEEETTIYYLNIKSLKISPFQSELK